jgi:hypothetical protein
LRITCFTSSSLWHPARSSLSGLAHAPVATTVVVESMVAVITVSSIAMIGTSSAA